MKFLISLLLFQGVMMSSSLGESGFIHPGLLHSSSDLERIRVAVDSKKGPIFDGFQVLENSPYSKEDYRMRGPFPKWGRAPNIRKGETESDALAAYQNALMWAITGKKGHAKKAIQILNSWTSALKKVGGIDGVLAAGLQGFMFVNAAELLRHTDSGWSKLEARRCGQWFRDVWDPTIEHYAYFANGNWETAALQTRMAIAVYCDERRMFEETVRYAVAGAGNGSIPHMIVYPSGQCQEATRAQHYVQLGIGLLACAAEVAWNQGVDLYGWQDNRILRGYEYTARYGLGEEVPFRHYLDRTGKYGRGGRYHDYTEISPVSRGNFYPIFERIFNHYRKRRGIPAPYSKRVVQMKEPEGFNNDHIGLGTLSHRRESPPRKVALNPPGTPSGFVARSVPGGIRISWVGSVDPVGCIDAGSYEVGRSASSGGPYEPVASSLGVAEFLDADVKKGELYYYSVTAENAAGSSAPSAEISASAGLPGPWSSADVGKTSIPGYAEYDGKAFSLEGEGKDIGGRSDEFHYLHARMKGDGIITARIRRPMSSQWTKPGVMMRKDLEEGSPHVSVLLQPHWSGALVSRGERGGETMLGRVEPLGEQYVIKKNRLSAPYWVRLKRVKDTFSGYMSHDGTAWQELGSVELEMGPVIHVGMPACSQLEDVTTTVTYDRVSIPSWSMPGS